MNLDMKLEYAIQDACAVARYTVSINNDPHLTKMQKLLKINANHKRLQLCDMLFSRFYPTNILERSILLQHRVRKLEKKLLEAKKELSIISILKEV